jgi:hypothetical protein
MSGEPYRFVHPVVAKRDAALRSATEQMAALGRTDDEIRETRAVIVRRYAAKHPRVEFPEPEEGR